VFPARCGWQRPLSISDSLLAPLVGAFQASYPGVRVQIFITERIVDQIAEGVDLAFRVGELEDSSLVARRILTYRHLLVASPTYLKKCKAPRTCSTIGCSHFLSGSPRTSGTSFMRPERDKETLTFQPHLSIDEYAGLATALLADSASATINERWAARRRCG
jgi:DNA-binding transcriptional LysR family regulator